MKQNINPVVMGERKENMEELKVEYRPEFENAVTLEDMGLEKSRWATTIEMNLSHSGKEVYGILERPKFRNMISKTILLRTKGCGERIYWLDKDGKVVAYCDAYLPKMIDEYIREYRIPRVKSETEKKELMRSLSGGKYPMIGEIVLIRTYPLTIREKREEIGMSRAELSRQLEIPIRTLENWESGKNQPPAWAEKLIIDKLDQIGKEFSK